MSKIVQLNQEELDVISGSVGRAGVFIASISGSLIGGSRNDIWAFCKGFAAGWGTCEAKRKIKDSPVMVQMVTDFKAQQTDSSRCYVDDRIFI